MNSRVGSGVGLIGFMAMFAFAPLAAAQPQSAADEHLLTMFRQGRSLMDAHRYAEAIPLFEQVLAARESAGARFNLGLSLRALNRCREATAAFERAAAIDTDSARRDSALVNVSELRACVGRVSVELRGQPGEVRVDGAVVTLVGGRDVLTLDPGNHVFEARREGYQSAVVSVSVARGEQRAVVLEVRPRAPAVELRRATRQAPEVVRPEVSAVDARPQNEARVDGGVATRWWFWTVVGLAVAGGTVGFLAATGAFDREGPGLVGSWGTATAAIRWE